MNDSILQLIKRGAVIRIVGDSIAAGAGSSESFKTDEIILKDGDQIFYRRKAPNSWWGRFETYLKEKFPECTVINDGCGGAFSYQIRNAIDNFYSDKDDIIIIMLGCNDRKRNDGLKELEENLTYIIKYYKDRNKKVIVMNTNPSTLENEYYQNRIYHTEDIANIISRVAEEESVLLVDNYNYILQYLLIRREKIDDIIYNYDSNIDGLHPSDRLQFIMYFNLLSSLGLHIKYSDINEFYNVK